MSDSVQPHRRQPTRLPRPWDSPGKNTGVGCHFLLQCMKVKSESEVAQSCLTLSDPRDCSPPGSSIPGIFQARVLEWGAIAFSSWKLNEAYFLSSQIEEAERICAQEPQEVRLGISEKSKPFSHILLYTSLSSGYFFFFFFSLIFFLIFFNFYYFLL